MVDVDAPPWPNPFKRIILAQSSLRSPGRMASAPRPAIFSRPEDASAEMVSTVENRWVKAGRVVTATSGLKMMQSFHRKHQQTIFLPEVSWGTGPAHVPF